MQRENLLAQSIYTADMPQMYFVVSQEFIFLIRRICWLFMALFFSADSAVTRPPGPGSTSMSTPETIPITPPRVPIQDAKQVRPCLVFFLCCEYCYSIYRTDLMNQKELILRWAVE